jgi:hypothetical protein
MPVSTERERVGAPVDLAYERRGLVVEVRHGPAAALESAAEVLVRPADPLPNSVDGDEPGGRQLHGRGSFSLVDFRRSWHGPCRKSQRVPVWGPYRVRKPSARLTCHMWPSGRRRRRRIPISGFQLR